MEGSLESECESKSQLFSHWHASWFLPDSHNNIQDHHLTRRRSGSRGLDQPNAVSDQTQQQQQVVVVQLTHHQQLQLNQFTIRPSKTENKSKRTNCD